MHSFANEIIAAELGKTHLFSVGQAGFIIKSKSGALLGIDLYLSECVEALEGSDGYKRLLPIILKPDEIELDYLITTHFHRDHFDEEAVPILMRNKKTKLFAAYDCVDDIKKLEIDDNRVSFVGPGDCAEADDIKIKFINCDHGTGAPKAVGAIVSVNEKIILFTGDTCLRLDRKDEYLSEGKIDYLVAPINGAYGNLNEDDCATLAKCLNPKITIPSHYWMFASHGGSLEKFRTLMINSNLPYFIMRMGEKLVVE